MSSLCKKSSYWRNQNYLTCAPYSKSISFTFPFRSFFFFTFFSHPFLIPLSLPFYPLPCCLYPKLMENMIKLLKNLLVLYFGSIRNARIRIITISTSNNAGSSNCRQKGQLSPPGRRQHSLVIILFSFVMTLSCEVFWRGQSWLSFKLTSGL